MCGEGEKPGEEICEATTGAYERFFACALAETGRLPRRLLRGKPEAETGRLVGISTRSVHTGRGPADEVPSSISSFASFDGGGNRGDGGPAATASPPGCVAAGTSAAAPPIALVPRTEQAASTGVTLELPAWSLQGAL